MNRWWFACLVIAFVARVACSDQTTAPPPKRPADDVFSIEGVVTFVEREWHTLFVQRDGDGFFVELADVIPSDLKRGDSVEVTGRRPKPNSHYIGSSTIRKSGNRGLPKPIDLSAIDHLQFN